MRNVTPPSDPDLLLRQLKGQDELKRYMAGAWRQITADLRMFLADISEGLHNRHEKLRAEFYDWKFWQEEDLAKRAKEIRTQQAATIGALAQEVADLRQEVRSLREQKRRRKEKKGGRPVLVFGDAAPSTPSNHEAEAA